MKKILRFALAATACFAVTSAFAVQGTASTGVSMRLTSYTGTFSFTQGTENVNVISDTQTGSGSTASSGLSSAGATGITDLQLTSLFNSSSEATDFTTGFAEKNANRSGNLVIIQNTGTSVLNMSFFTVVNITGVAQANADPLTHGAFSDVEISVFTTVRNVGSSTNPTFDFGNSSPSPVVAGTYSATNDPTDSFNGSFSDTYSYNIGVGQELVINTYHGHETRAISAVPEPATLTLLALGALAAAKRKRK